jgi:hypothetical protein
MRWHRWSVYWIFSRLRWVGWGFPAYVSGILVFLDLESRMGHRHDVLSRRGEAGRVLAHGFRHSLQDRKRLGEEIRVRHIQLVPSEGGLRELL